MKKTISDIFNEAHAKYFKKAKIEVLRENYSPHIEMLLDYVYGDYHWNLERKQYKYIRNVDDKAANATRLLSNVRKLHYFQIGGPYPDMTPVKREAMFISFLETFNVDDAELMCYIVNNDRLPQKSLSKELIAEAFPKLKEKWKLK